MAALLLTLRELLLNMRVSSLLEDLYNVLAGFVLQWRCKCLKGESNRGYTIFVYTADRQGAGTDANVFFRIYDEGFNPSQILKLDNIFIDDHERASCSIFCACHLSLKQSPNQIELWRDNSGLGEAWCVDRIEVRCNATDAFYIFPIHRWIPHDRRLKIQLYDAYLPHEELEIKQRRTELEDAKVEYRFAQSIPGGPAQCAVLPNDEKFLEDYVVNILWMKAKMQTESIFKTLFSSDIKTFEDVSKIYSSTTPEVPVKAYWHTDEWFGLQRVQGTNPLLITLLEQIPANINLDVNRIEGFLESFTLQDAIKSKKIFYVDLKILQDVPTLDNRYLPVPIALFYLNSENKLLPVAIQLEQSENDLVFYPDDPPMVWLAAKMYYNLGDCTFHQACSHLCFTHLIMDGIAVCAHRNLSPSHPVLRLLKPHFLYLMAINARGIRLLLNPGGWVDKTMAVGCAGLFEIIQRGRNTLFNLDVYGCPEKHCKMRGVWDRSVLPWYPYRDDAGSLYSIIRQYVTDTLTFHYGAPETLALDTELRAFRLELTRPLEQGGCEIRGVPGSDISGFETITEVVECLSAMITICSVGHAASNFQQYDEYGFPPNYPAFLTKPMLRSKEPLSEQDLVSLLPSPETLRDTLAITRILSNKNTKSLGDFEVQYLYHPHHLAARLKFRQELLKLSKNIQERNANCRYPYPWLDPAIVPNAISI